MSRKFRATEISGFVNIESNGQHMKSNMFCVNCHCISTYGSHYPDCKKNELYAIPATAEVPKKHSSKRKWDIFKNQFVFSKPVGWWYHIGRSFHYKDK
jgi:hypothetical protein